MRRTSIAALSVCAVLAAGAANAGEVMPLTESQMDQVTAGQVGGMIIIDGRAYQAPIFTVQLLHLGPLGAAVFLIRLGAELIRPTPLEPVQQQIASSSAMLIAQGTGAGTGTAR